MDLATIIGLIGAVVSILITLLLGGSFSAFVDYPSMVIVIGGTTFCVMTSFSMEEVGGFAKIIRNAFMVKVMSANETIQLITGFAEKARREGLLALEDAMGEVTDSFLQSGLQLVVDGTDPELVQDILQTELAFVEDRHKNSQEMLNKASMYAPAFGMIGTLIGLIQMLSSLDDPSAIGPGMAVALLTTFYGAVLANVVFLPLKSKLEVRSKQEILLKEIIIEGLLSIQAGNNPRIVEEKLSVFLSPKMRDKGKDAAEGGGGE